MIRLRLHLVNEPVNQRERAAWLLALLFFEEGKEKMIWNYYVNSVTELSPDFLNKIGISALILDIDNTLTVQDGSEPYCGVKKWLSDIKASGISVILLSNNSKERIKPFADSLDVGYVYKAAKPLKKGIGRALNRLSVEKTAALVVGDQIFTDILAGRFFGIRTVLTVPIMEEKSRFFKFKRFCEKIVIGKRKPKRIDEYVDEVMKDGR